MKQLRHGYPYGVYQQFTYVAHTNQPSALTRCCSEPLRSYLTIGAHPMGATLSEELHTPPLPVTHVFLGYRWSYSGSATISKDWLDNGKQSFRSVLWLNKYP